MKSGSEVGYNFEIINSVLNVNDKQKTVLVDKVKNYYGDIKGMRFALWGLAFKPDTDDIREASAIYMIQELLDAGASVVAFDPEAMENVKSQVGADIEFATSQYEALEGADALLIATEWSAFRNPDFDKMKTLLKMPIIFDGRNLFGLKDMENKGFYYSSIGRRTVLQSMKIES